MILKLLNSKEFWDIVCGVFFIVGIFLTIGVYRFSKASVQEMIRLREQLKNTKLEKTTNSN